ncbi:MAG TPA: hypothetical protein VGJ59_09450 [Jatrophihabitantaceae bacterium]|jgi:hypothetical protein
MERADLPRPAAHDCSTPTAPLLSGFEAVEREQLKPLPRTVFVLAAWPPTVGPDIHMRVGKSLYSVPWRFIGAKVDAHSTATTVQIFHRGEVIATHPFTARGKQTDFSHYPPEKIAFRMRIPGWCRPVCRDRQGHRRRGR